MFRDCRSSLWYHVLLDMVDIKSSYIMVIYYNYDAIILKVCGRQGHVGFFSIHCIAGFAYAVLGD